MKHSIEHKGFKVTWVPTRFIGLYGFQVSKGTYSERSVCNWPEQIGAIEEAKALIDLGLFTENYAYYLKDTGKVA